MKRNKAVVGLALAATMALTLAACGGGGGTSGTANGGTTPTSDAGTDAGTDPTSDAGTDPGEAPQAEKVFKLAFNQTEQHPQYIAAQSFAKKLAEQTDGRYTIEVFANELLGSQNEVVENLTQGTVEMMFIGGPVMESFNKDFAVFNLPYMFDSIEAQDKVFTNDELLAPLFSSLEESKSITVLEALFAGVRNVYNRVKPIVTTADMDGLKIRVQQSESQIAMINAMGGVGTPMGQGEVYTALQSGVLDGAENNETVYDALKHDEVAKYYSYTRHLMIPDYLLIHTDTLNAMDPADQEIFLKLAEECRVEANEGFVTFVAESIENAKALGANFNDDVDVESFKSAVESMKDQYITSDLQKKLAEAVAEANGS